jgi:putative hydrolase of the HAD superfamily
MKAIFFDLDNTLYDTHRYYLGAFEKISDYLSSKFQINKEQIYKFLVNLWGEKSSMYSHLFDDLLEHQNLSHDLIPDLLKIFNEHQIEKIDLYKDVIPVLKNLGKNYKIGLITDGTVSRQSRKIQSLEIEKFFDVVIFTKNLEPKPSPKPYNEALDKTGIKSQDSIYVGDNPLLDFKGAKQVGMKTIRVRRGEFETIANNDDVDFTIKNLFELEGILRK